MKCHVDVRMRPGEDERGFALIAALGMLLVLSIVGVTILSYSSTNSRTAVRSKTDNLSFSLSEAGLANALSILNNPSNNALDQDILPSSEATASTSAYEGGTAKWWGVLDRAQAVWSVTGVGLFTNPTGAGAAQVRRKLSAKVPVFPTNTQAANAPAWNYIYARATGSACDMTLSNNVSGNSRLYVAGNLCLNNNAVVTSESLIVHGNLDLSNNAQVGSSGTRVETYVGGNCRYAGGSWATPCTGDQDSRRIYSKLMPGGAVGVNNTATIVPEPEADFGEWYENAIPGPAQPCTTTSGTPPVFDNNYPTRNNNVPSFNLTPSSSYTCRVGTASTPSGELSWNNTTKILTVAGTIFIDGSAYVSNGTLSQYNGQATLYLSGTFVINNNSKLCGGVSGSNCDFASWNPNTEMLTIVTEGSGGLAGSGNGILIDENGQFQGGLFAQSAVEYKNNARSDGPIVGSTVKLGNNVQNDQFPTLTVVPAGMPGNPVVYAQPNPPELFSG